MSANRYAYMAALADEKARLEDRLEEAEKDIAELENRIIDLEQYGMQWHEGLPPTLGSYLATLEAKDSGKRYVDILYCFRNYEDDGITYSNPVGFVDKERIKAWALIPKPYQK